LNPTAEYIADIFCGSIVISAGALAHSWATWAVGLAMILLTVITKNVSAWNEQKTEKP